MKQILEQLIQKHLASLGIKAPQTMVVEPPNAPEHGDLSCNVAMVLAKELQTSPRLIADKLVDSIRAEDKIFKNVEVKGPGFINFFFREETYQEALRDLWVDPLHLKRLDLGEGKKVLIEFVSANPTGPMHVGHGRNAAVGDCISRLLEAVGYEVTREFYINDHGVQVQTLGVSAAYYYKLLTQSSDVPEAPPEGSYQGEYLETLVAGHKEEIASLIDSPMELGKYLGVKLLERIKSELADLKVHFQNYFSESSLYQNHKIDLVLEILKQKKLSYEQEGALWFRTRDFGDDKDRVLIKKDGTYTYLTPDIAYHKDKFDRGFDLYINVMGADHGGYVKRIHAAIEALGGDPKKLNFLLMQLVSLKRGGEVVSMSKRSGDYVTLEEVISEVGSDAARFFFLMRSHHQKLEFDLELAKQKSVDNPVYYVQYAHARMCSIFEKAIEAGYVNGRTMDTPDLSALVLPEEIDLIKMILNYQEVLQIASLLYEPHRVAFYLMELAKIFQNYYTQGKTDPRYRVISEDASTTLAKLFLIKTLREVFRLGLNILGVSAPEKM